MVVKLGYNNVDLNSLLLYSAYRQRAAETQQQLNVPCFFAFNNHVASVLKRCQSFRCFFFLMDKKRFEKTSNKFRVSLSRYIYLKIVYCYYNQILRTEPS